MFCSRSSLALSLLTCLCILLVPVVSGCGDDAGIGDGGLGDATMDAALPPDAAIDSVVPDVGTAPDICDELGLARRPFDDRAAGIAYGSVAGDFSFETTEGPFRLSEAWTGCESYVFINYFESEPGDQIWNSFADPLFENSRRNAQYFFTSYETSPGEVAARVDQMRANVEEALSFLAPEDADFWRGRVHYVTTPLRDVEGSLGALVRNRTSVEFAIGIDRAQRYDPVGSLAEVTSAGFVSRLGMAAWASHYYDYRWELDERLADTTGVVVVPLAEETDFSERSFDRSVTLPDAAAMAGFDSFEVDVQVECHAGPGDCSEWDRIASIYVCTDATCTDLRELVRWITPYSRPGRRRWAIDATPMLGLLADGGDRTFRIVMGPGFERATVRDVAVSLRFSNRGAPDRPFGAELAYRGGAFDATYNAAHPPYRFTPPVGTTRVEVVTIVSGHGQTAGDNCAEWCNHEHITQVGTGTAHRLAFPGMAGTRDGCANLAGAGVIPGQYGNWAPLRAGWCPGLPVTAQRFDVTADVTVGVENELSYQAAYAGSEPRGGDIELSTYLVYYR